MSVYGLYFDKSNYSAANATINSSLPNIKSQLINMSNEIASYCHGAATKLSGDSFEILLNRLNMCSEACKNIADAIDVATNNMLSCNNAVINAIGSDFPTISGENLKEIESEISVLIRKNELASYSLYNNNDTKSILEESTKSFIEMSIRNRNYQISQLEKSKRILENALINANSADSNGAANLSGINGILNNINNIFIAK